MVAEALPRVSTRTWGSVLLLTRDKDLSLGATYIPGLAGLGQSMDALAVIPVASALLGPVVGLAAAKATLGHFR